MTAWTPRVRHSPGPRDLESLCDAAEDLADQAGRTPGNGRGVFQNVYSVALLATVVISGALAGVHLYKALCPKQREDRHGRLPDPGIDREAAAGRELSYRHRLAAGDDASERGRSRGG